MRELVHELQTELAGSGDHDGGSGDLDDPHNDPAVGSALPSRIRKALAPLRSVRRRIVEDGRDIYKGSRTMGVPVPRRRQSGPDGGFLPQPETPPKEHVIRSGIRPIFFVALRFTATNPFSGDNGDGILAPRDTAVPTTVRSD